MKNYPRYFILGQRPVKLILNEQGEMGALSFNWDTGIFELDWDAYLRIYKPGSDAESVSEDEFEKCVEELLIKLKEKKSR